MVFHLYLSIMMFGIIIENDFNSVGYAFTIMMGSRNFFVYI